MRVNGRLMVAMFVAALAVPATLLAPGVGAGAGPNSVFLVKTVSGPVPAGTVFTIQIDCDGSVQERTFDATGAALGGTGVSAGADDTCTVTETGSGGAAAVSYSCVSDPSGPCAAAGPQGVPMVVRFDGESFEATVTIANTFADPAAAVEAAPAFTG